MSVRPGLFPSPPEFLDSGASSGVSGSSDAADGYKEDSPASRRAVSRSAASAAGLPHHADPVTFDAVGDRLGFDLVETPEALFGEQEDRVLRSFADFEDVESVTRAGGLPCRLQRFEEVVLDRADHQQRHVRVVERAQHAVAAAEGRDLVGRFEPSRQHVHVERHFGRARDFAQVVLVGAHALHARRQSGDVATRAAGFAPRLREAPVHEEHAPLVGGFGLNPVECEGRPAVGVERGAHKRPEIAVVRTVEDRQPRAVPAVERRDDIVVHGFVIGRSGAECGIAQPRDELYFGGEFVRRSGNLGVRGVLVQPVVAPCERRCCHCEGQQSRKVFLCVFHRFWLFPLF